MWVHRRSEEPSPTSVECYWKKSVLSSVGTSIKFMYATELGNKPKPVPEVPSTFLQQVKEEAKYHNSKSQLLKHINEERNSSLSLHNLIHNFVDEHQHGDDADLFLNFCSQAMDSNLCSLALKNTEMQCNSPSWHELRYARITASKLYEVAHCCTLEGSLVEKMLGLKNITTAAMKRGSALEPLVLLELKKNVSQNMHTTGLHLSPFYPVFGASPDALGKDFVVEIKCPSSSKSKTLYISKSGEITSKFKAQMNLQMLLCNKNKAIFCIADPKFEENKKISYFWYVYDPEFTQQLMADALHFWKAAIFPKLMKSV